MYTLTFVFENGKAHMTSAEGYFAESLLDAQFTRLKDDKRVIFAVVVDNTGSIRQRYVRVQ